jgi:hypothetical protein
MAHMAPIRQITQFITFKARHVAKFSWNHMAPHGALRQQPFQQSDLQVPTWHALSRLFSTSVPCVPCAPTKFHFNLCDGAVTVISPLPAGTRLHFHNPRVVKSPRAGHPATAN